MKYYRYGWRGDFASWKDAQAASTGYQAAQILAKVKASTLLVKSGQAVYERDSMLFDKIEYSWPLLANLLWVAGVNSNFLSVLDFGGSLGSTYFQNRRYLNQLRKVTWSVIEQPGFVEAGRREITNEQLDFFESVDAAIAQKGQHTILLLSCVLPYIEKPFDLLKNLAAKNVPYIIIENTYFNTVAVNRLTVQKVPPVYYDASYPAWFLNYDEVLMALHDKYDMVAEYNNDQFLYLKGQKIKYKGFIMQLKNHT